MRNSPLVVMLVYGIMTGKGTNDNVEHCDLDELPHDTMSRYAILGNSDHSN